MYYHGTGSENAGRAYTEAPMQHVQRNALRKKCMKSTFTLLEIHTSKTSFSFFVCLSIFHIRVHTHTRTRTHTCSCTFFRHHRSLSLTLFLSIYLSHSPLLSLYLIQKSPMYDLSKYKYFSRILPKSSRLVYRVSYISAFVYSVRKMHINTEVHFDASSATPGSLSHCSFDGDRYPQVPLLPQPADVSESKP